MPTSSGSRTITFILHEEPPHGWWAESPDIPGYSAAAGTADEVKALCRRGVEFATGIPHTEVTRTANTAAGTANTTPISTPPPAGLGASTGTTPEAGGLW